MAYYFALPGSRFIKHRSMLDKLASYLRKNYLAATASRSLVSLITSSATFLGQGE